jgi:hypothetical protein
VIEAGTFGLHRRLVVSPQHRVLLTHWMAELMFGEDEVLVAAKDLVNDCSVRIVEGGTSSISTCCSTAIRSSGPKVWKPKASCPDRPS